ncbi:MAG: 4-hydroxybenzoate octaprenyltransferase [Anaplasma sp.]
MLTEKVKSVMKEYAPYFALFRLHSVEISLLAAFPTFSSIVLASDNLLKALWLFVLTIIAAVVVRSAGCVVNDIFDRKIDAQVERTKDRPLASGKLTVYQALKALVPLVLVALGILALTNALTFYISVVCAVGIVLYPLAKRHISCPQFVLGFVWNCGVLIGSAMASGTLTLGSVLLYIGCIFWTTAYDTIYAHQDRRDDVLLGLGSTAITFGDDTRLYIRRLYTLTITMWVCAGLVSALGIAYYLFLLGIAGMFYYQYRESDFDSPSKCMYMFKINIYAGIVHFFGVLFGKVGV